MLGVALSTQVVLWMLLGGAGTLIGPVIGVGLYQFAEFKLSERFPTWWSIGFGALVVIVVLILPDGIVGTVVKHARRASSTNPTVSRHTADYATARTTHEAVDHG
jgi:branched-chain amino acid transport system permease protein